MIKAAGSGEIMRKERTVGEAYDSVAGFYDEHFSTVMWKADKRALFCWLEELQCLRGHVVDLGCGTGLALDFVPQERYTGVDVSEGMLLEASQKHPGTYLIQADMCNTGLKPGIADSVISVFGGFSYVRDPILAVLEIDRILAPGGRFAVMVYGNPARECPDIVEETGPELANVFYSADSLEEVFGVLGRVQVQGFRHSDRDDMRKAHAEDMPLLVSAEIKTKARTEPNNCDYLIAIGQKNA